MLASKDKKFYGNMIVLMTGATGAQVIGLLLMPIVTRLYSPGNFGLMTTFGTIVLTVSVVSCGCYEQAIALPRDERSAWAVTIIALFNCLMVSIITLLIIFLGYDYISKHIFNRIEFSWLWCLPIAVFLSGFRLISNYWVIRKKKFKELSFSKIAEVLGNSGIKTLSGLTFGDMAGGLISGILGRSLFPSIFLFPVIKWISKISDYKIPPRKFLLSIAKLYRNFLYYSTFSQLLVNISRGIPIFFLAVAFKNDIVGAFGLADNALRLPVGVIGQSVREVYLQKAADQRASRQKLSHRYLKMTYGLLAVAIMPFGLLFFYGPEIFLLVFGPEWETAGKFAQVLSPMLLTMCVNPPSTVVFTVLQKQRIYLFLMVLVAAVRLTTLTIGLMSGLNSVYMIGWFSFASTILNILIMICAYRLILTYEKQLRPDAAA